MIKLSRTLSGVLMATTALMASQVAFAQTQPLPAQQADPAQDPVIADDEVAVTDEIVVLGRNIPEPVRETAEVVSFLSAEDLQRQGDDTAAEALTRVTGLSLIGGRFVYVRGLGERYSSALLNGSPLPSPEPLQRVVPLDLFPSSILENVRVQKTYSPNYWGEFGGGVIELSTVGVPSRPFFSIAVGAGVNLETTLEPGLTYYGSDTDPLGFDDGTRDVPNPLQDAIRSGQRVGPGPYTDAELAAIGRSLQNAPLNLLQRTKNVWPNGSVEFAGGRSFDVGFADFGFIVVGGYENSWQTRRGEQGNAFLDAGELTARRSFDFVSTQNDVTWNGLFGLSLEANDHEIRWTNLYVRSTQKEARSQEGFEILTTNPQRDDFTEWFERELFDTQFAGEHRFGDFRVDWRGSYAAVSREAPYEKSITYELIDGQYFYTGQNNLNRTRFSNLQDDVWSAGVDLTWEPVVDFVQDLTLTAGYEYLKNERKSEQRDFFFRTTRPLTEAEQMQRVDFLFSDYNIRPDLFVLQEGTGADGAAAYDADLEVNALYVQAEGEIFPTVRLAIGGRFEEGDLSVRTVDLFGGPEDLGRAIQEEYFLPAATLTWNFAEDQQVRFGASKTIARPQFRELAEQQYLDPESDRLFVGNPFLTDTELVNLDARYERYFERNQYFTAGVFYKMIENPIEAVASEQGATLFQTFLNAPKANLYGFEVEAKKFFEPTTGLGFVDERRWLIAANYTYSKAELQVDEGDTVIPRGSGGVALPASNFFEDGARLQGQSEHLANLQFGFEDDVNDVQATFLVNYASERTTARGQDIVPDIVNEPGTMLDFTFRKGFTALGKEMTFGFEARNLLDEDFEEYQELGDRRVDVNTYDLGRSFSFSLTARF